MWFKDLDISKIDDARYKLFEYIVSVKKLKSSDLSISYSTFSRVRNRKILVSDSLLIKILQHTTSEEFNRVVSAGERLKLAGIVREDGSVDYSAALELVRYMLRDEYLRNIVLRCVVDIYREDLRKLLGVGFVGVKLEWSEDFERFLRESKRFRKVRTEEMIRKYRSYFERYLQGRELSEELVYQIAEHTPSAGSGTSLGTMHSTSCSGEGYRQRPTRG